MNYPVWNNAIGAHLFNEENAGKEVLLYLTKEEIIAIGREHFPSEDDTSLWRNFIFSIKSGTGGGSQSIVVRARNTYDKWLRSGTSLTINGVRMNYPLYLSYLVFFVLPLTEGAVNGDYTLNNYWGRMDDFLKENRCPRILNGEFKEHSVNSFWNNLSQWANAENNGAFGLFRVNEFINNRFAYVGKPFSQCVMPPKVIEKLPVMFSKAGLIPGERQSHVSILQCTIAYGTHVGINNRVLKYLAANQDDELSNFVARIVKRAYESWKGESDVDTRDRVDRKRYRYDVIAKLVQQLEIDEDNEIIKIKYRVKSSSDFPEDLSFGGTKVYYERNGYSKAIEVSENLVCFELKDDFNRWIAKTPFRQVRVFANGSNFQLSSAYWIEVDSLYRGQSLYVLAPLNKKVEITEWASTHCTNYKLIQEAEGLPIGVFLIKVSGISQGCEAIPEMSLEKDIALRLIGGLQFKHRTYADSSLPEIEIINGLPSDSLVLRYQGDQETVQLNKSSINNNWELPANILRDKPFRLIVANREQEDNLSYTITSANGASIQLGDTQVPIRDQFENIVVGNNGNYIRGLNRSNPHISRQAIYLQYFKGHTSHTEYVSQNISFNESLGDKLLSFLTLKRSVSLKEFFESFEELTNKSFAENSIALSRPIQILRRAALTYYVNLGFIDFDYENRKIAVIQPQLILMPTKEDRRVLLIGGRDNELIEKFIELAKQHELTVSIEGQHKLNKDLLLPSVITIQSHAYPNDPFGERRLKIFANDLGIRYDSENLVPIGLQDFSASIDGYQNMMLHLNEVNAKDYGWARYIFNTETLELEHSKNEHFDKGFSFVEYKLNAWEIEHRLWVDGKCYKVDRNWGKYLALKASRNNVILYDEANCKAAVPVNTPLPRYLAMSLSLLSGIAPVVTNINSRRYRIYENVSSVFIQNLFAKLSQTITPVKINY